MKQSFGRYEFTNSASISRLNYKRSLKDWYDISISGVFGLICLAVIYFAILEQSKNDFNWIYVILVLCFGFVALWKLSYSISRLSEPTKEIIRLEKTSGNVYLKLPHFKKLKINVSELYLIEYRLHKDKYEIENHIKDRFWVEIELITNTKNKIKVLNINPFNLIDMGSEKTKNELLRMSKKIVKKISQELEIESRWRGIINEENK